MTNTEKNFRLSAAWIAEMNKRGDEKLLLSVSISDDGVLRCYTRAELSDKEVSLILSTLAEMDGKVFYIDKTRLN